MNKTPVSILQEMMIKNKITPNYELIHDGGGSHMNVFAYQVKCDDLIASGIGRSKKDAKHEAAKAMLEIIATHRGYLQLPASPVQSPVRTPLPPTIPEIPRIPPDIPFVNAVGALQDFCVENNLQDPKYQQISDVGPPHAKIFTIECEVATLKEIGIAKTKKQAKQEAAKKMLDKLSDLVPNLNNISDKKKQNIDQEMENSNKIAKAQYTKLSKLPAAKKVNLGVKLSEYHIQFKSQYDDETRKEIIERILSVIPSNQNHVSEECIEHLIKKFEDILIDIGLDFTSLCIPSSENIIVAMRINTCPSIVELALGETKSETKLRALQKQPLRSKLNIGIVSYFDPIKEIGVIGKDTVFNKRICDTGYIPCVGDKVINDSIESDQGIYTWRSLTVVPVIQTSIKKTKLPMLYNTFTSKKNLNELVKDKCGIVISDNINIDLNVEEEKNVTVIVENVGNTTHVLCKGCFMIKKAHSQLSLIQPIIPNTILNPSDKLSYIFKCTAKFIGISKELFIFNFKDFEIGRIFNITIKPKTIKNKSYSKNNNVNINYIPNLDEWNEATYIPGIRPCKPPSFIKVRNMIFKVPKHYWDIISKCINEGKSQTESEYDVGNAIPCLLNRLCFESYKDRFHALLYLEEIAQTINLQQYNIDSTIMRRSGEYLVMEVPGLAEKRPSLLVGDRAIVSFKWDSSQGKLKYEGFIHKITNLEIFLKFNYKFHQEYNYDDCQVSFKCSQSVMQRCHNAINMAVHRLGQNFLFPTHVIEKESQLDIEEFEIKDNSIFKQTHQRTNSVSSESSSTSTTSTSNKSNSTIKSFTKMSVVQRLFNVEPIEQNLAMKSDIIVKDEYIKTKDGMNVIKDAMHKLPDSNSSYNIELQPIISQVRKRKLHWFNKNLNYYQKEAVKNILKGHARPLPYVIFGPPGTGKTITLCETILQILSIIPESRLLVATPSNSSANLIAERLLDSGVLKPGDMVRLIAYHCLGNDSIPSKLLPYCATAELADETTIEKIKYNGVGPKLNCTMSILGRHRITIGTCIALGILNNMGFPCGHFSHVLVDEAGQATEPEIMIPLNFIHSDYGQVVLAGDPLQLGPVVQSGIAKNFGLDDSFLLRLLRHFPYQRDPNGFETHYDPRLVTKLIINYRSLPEILELSSSLFYDSELKAQISSKKSKEAKLLQTLASELPKRKGIPPAIVFHGVNGENCKDNDSPSWYNPEEATQVYLYLLKLYKCGLSPDDIGIITPYQKQVLQIRELLMELNIELPKISSVEGFQGQERNVIIISAVRSSTNFVNEDIKHSLGFVACPRRLNVAVTRARVLVIILGNPKLLAQDPYWKSILIYCINQDSYTGCSFGFSNMEDSCIEANNSFISNEINKS